MGIYKDSLWKQPLSRRAGGTNPYAQINGSPFSLYVSSYKGKEVRQGPPQRCMTLLWTLGSLFPLRFQGAYFAAMQSTDYKRRIRHLQAPMLRQRSLRRKAPLAPGLMREGRHTPAEHLGKQLYKPPKWLLLNGQKMWYMGLYQWPAGA